MNQRTTKAAPRSHEPGELPAKGPDHATLRFLTERDVCAVLAIGRSTLNRRVRTDPEFPQPRRCGGRTIRWLAAEIHEYMFRCPRAEYDDHAFDPNTGGRP